MALPRQPRAILVLLAWILVAGSAEARSTLKSFCLDDALFDLKLDAAFSVPLGCQLVDCCVGCPGPGPIDLRLRVKGAAVDFVTVVFDGLPDETPLVISGDGYRHGEGVAVVPGEARIHRLPIQGDEGVPIATIRVTLDGRQVEQIRNAPGAEPSRIHISVEQMMARHVVDELTVDYMVHPCSDRFELCDRITQNGKLATKSSAVLIDGRRGDACFDDSVARGAGAIAVANLQARATCNSEVAVFAESNAAAFETPVDSWTDSCGDELIVDLDPALTVPLNVWLARAAPTAASDVSNVKLHFNDNKVGMAFAPTEQTVTSGLTSLKLLGCAAASGLPGSGFYVKDQINVYYINSVFALSGASCESDRNVILIGPLSNGATLAHELGHAFSLFGNESTWGHTNQAPGFTSDNLMWGGGADTRKHLSLGQVFRLNFDPESQLNRNPIRSGPERACPAMTATELCPPLKLDWVRP